MLSIDREGIQSNVTIKDTKVTENMLFFHISESYQSYTFVVYPGQYIWQWAGETNLPFLIFTENKLKMSYPLAHFKVPLPISLLGSPTRSFSLPLVLRLPSSQLLSGRAAGGRRSHSAHWSAEETLLTISHTLIKAKTQRLLHTRIQIGILATLSKKRLSRCNGYWWAI